MGNLSLCSLGKLGYGEGNFANHDLFQSYSDFPITIKRQAIICAINIYDIAIFIIVA